MKTKAAFILTLLYLASYASYAKTESFTIEISESLADFQAEVLTQSRGENYRNTALDYYLSEKKIELPEDDFILIAYQPVGIVSSCIIIDLGKRIAWILPATHEEENERVLELTETEFDYLKELVASDLMKNFPSKNGKFGADGYSLAIYSKSGKTKRFISHWMPTYMGLDIFKSIHEHFKNKSNTSE